MEFLYFFERFTIKKNLNFTEKTCILNENLSIYVINRCKSR